jgi:hypothetical protein
MGSGSSIERSSGELKQPLLNRGGDGESRASEESASLVGKAETLVKYGTCPDPDIPDLEIPKMRIRDRVLELGLPEDLDRQDRARYEQGLFRLFFPGEWFDKCEDGKPPTFGTAIVPEEKLLRAVVERAITFADHVMHYAVDTCGIEPKRFLDAAARYGEVCEEKRQPGSIFEFFERYVSIGHPVTPKEQEDAQAVVSAFIEDVRTELEKSVTTVHEGYRQYALPYCQWAHLSLLTSAASVYPSLTDRGNAKYLYYLHCTVALCCLKDYQAILSCSADASHLFLAAKAASTITAISHRLCSREVRIKPEAAVEPLLDNLEKVGVKGDTQDACKCAQALEYLLPLAGRAVVILAKLRDRFKEGGGLNQLIETLESIGNPPRKVIEYLRR